MKSINKNTKVLILQENLSRYRLPIYQIIAQQVNLSVACLHTINCITDFPVIKLEYRKFGSFKICKNLNRLRSQFDVVIILPHLSCVSFCLIPFLRKRNRVLSWSNGSRASYTVPFDFNRKTTFKDHLYWRILKKCEANILYIKEAIPWLVKHGLSKESLFVAPNTTSIYEGKEQVEKKDIFLFVGTLYRKKGLDLLLKSYLNILKKTKDISTIPNLVLIGEGEEEQSLKMFVHNNGIDNKVIFTGGIYDEKILSAYFKRALMCISPTQAGLSVLKSFGYGVPFITYHRAVTGGEIVNIENEVNGILLKDLSDLENVMIDGVRNPQKYINMGINAKRYYNDTHTIYHMAQGVIDAIDYVLSNTKE